MRITGSCCPLCGHDLPDCNVAFKESTMDDTSLDSVTAEAVETTEAGTSKPGELPTWETPKLEDVSEQVMAQPYIRFT
jgi:hypothetical protein